MSDEGPTTYTIPSHRKTSCGMCKYHKCIGFFHVRSGAGGWLEYSCTNPNAWEPVTSTACTPEAAEALGRIRQIEEGMCGGGRYIGKTEETPEWCPFLREPNK